MDKILYIGDTAINQAACYLAGILTYSGIDFDYIANGTRCGIEDIDKGYKAFVVSDYPARDFKDGALDKMKELIAAGAGLFMPGGWESYTGLGGGYNKTVLAQVLPVIMSDSDDRVNSHGPCLVVKNSDHPIVEGLDFENDAPGIGGFNRFELKPDAALILSSHRYCASVKGDEATFKKLESCPLLAVGSFRLGRVAALATDLAPHWVGGLVDWGKKRITACAKGSIEIEVGADYAALLVNIIRWVSSTQP